MRSLRLGLFARFPKHFAGRADSKLEIDGILDGFSDQHRRVDPLESDVTVPAISIILVTIGSSAIENGPGPQVRASSPGGGRNFRTTSFAMLSHGLSSRVRQTMCVMIPPGFRAFRMFRNPATGLAKNIVPKREKTKSYSGSKWSSSASP